MDFALYPIWAIAVSFFAALGIQNKFLPKPTSWLLFIGILALFTRGIGLNPDYSELLSCELLPGEIKKLGARPLIAYKLESCGAGSPLAIETKIDSDNYVEQLSHLILRSDDSLLGYLQESGEWKIVARSPSKVEFVRGFGEIDLHYNLLQKL